jgi:predicted HTH transcriptional regulator
VGGKLIDVFFPGGTPVPKECALWDYKETFDGSKVAYAELAKDVLSFFNSYGGYLFLGVSETGRCQVDGCGPTVRHMCSYP